MNFEQQWTAEQVNALGFGFNVPAGVTVTGVVLELPPEATQTDHVLLKVHYDVPGDVAPDYVVGG